MEELAISELNMSQLKIHDDLMMIFHDDQKHMSSSQVHGLVAEK